MIEKAGCKLVDGLPKLKCREQTCEKCKITELLSLKNFEKTLDLPFPIDMKKPTHTYKTAEQIRNIERVEYKDVSFAYKHTLMKTVTFEEAWKFMFEEHPEEEQKIPFATSYLNHRAQVDWFQKEFTQLIDQKNPTLPLGTLLIMNDFSESPSFQHKDKTSDFIYCKQQILLGPTPCLFTVPDGKGGLKIILVEVNFFAEDPKHSSQRVLQIFEEAYLYMKIYMKENYGGVSSGSKSLS